MSKDMAKPAKPKPKLSVDTDPEMIRLIRIEKAETNRTIGELVNERLRLSYQYHPEPLASPAPSAHA